LRRDRQHPTRRKWQARIERTSTSWETREEAGESSGAQGSIGVTHPRSIRIHAEQRLDSDEDMQTRLRLTQRTHGTSDGEPTESTMEARRETEAREGGITKDAELLRRTERFSFLDTISFLSFLEETQSFGTNSQRGGNCQKEMAIRSMSKGIHV
jgi:hypothetical protein